MEIFRGQLRLSADYEELLHFSYIAGRLLKLDIFLGKFSVSILPGIDLSYIEMYAHAWPAARSSKAASVVEINYCLRGARHLHYSDGREDCQNSGEAAVSVQCGDSRFCFHCLPYEGIEFSIDLSKFESLPDYVLSLFSESPDALRERLLSGGKSIVISERPSAERKMAETLWNLYKDGPAEDAASIARIRTLSIHLISTFQCNISAGKHRASTKLTPLQQKIAQETESAVTADLSNPVSIRNLSARFKTSETSLKTYFLMAYGCGISDYLKEKRLEAAKDLLETTLLPISEIAARVGYQSQSKFSAFFKKQTGITPLSYRRQYAVENHTNRK